MQHTLGTVVADMTFATNSVAVTVGAATVDITAPFVITAASGERLRIGYSVRMDKGAVAGNTSAIMNIALTSGTWSFDGRASKTIFSATASVMHTLASFIIAVASGPGTLTINLQGSSAGSNSTVPIQMAVVTVERFLPGFLA